MADKLVRIHSGINGLDDLIEGGFEKGSSVLVTGSPGAGKTTFALQFLYYGATKFKEPGIFITFDESKEALTKHYREYGWDFDALEKKGLFKVLEYRPHQVNKLIGEGGGVIKDTIKTLGAKRLAIDSVTGYSLLFADDYLKRESIFELFELLKKWDATTLVTAEECLKKQDDVSVSYLTDAIIDLRYEPIGKNESRQHVLEIIKMRGTKHTNKICLFTFAPNGIKIYPDS